MTVLITDTGRVEQRLLDVRARPSTTAFLGELRASSTRRSAGSALAEAAAAARRRRRRSSAPERRALVGAVIARASSSRSRRTGRTGCHGRRREPGPHRETTSPAASSRCSRRSKSRSTLLRLFGEMEVDATAASPRSIGRENAAFGLGETSRARQRATRHPGGSVARLGVLGPTRMDYSNNMAAVRAVARYLSRLLGDD